MWHLSAEAENPPTEAENELRLSINRALHDAWQSGDAQAVIDLMKEK